MKCGREEHTKRGTCSYPASFAVTQHWLLVTAIVTSSPVGLQSTVMSMCLSVSPLTWLKNHMAEIHQIFYACCLWLWLGPPLTALRYIMYFQFDGWHVSYHGANGPKSSTTLVSRSLPGGGTSWTSDNCSVEFIIIRMWNRGRSLISMIGLL